MPVLKGGDKIRKFSIHKSKSGIPCMWETGGGYTNTGDATIIAGPNGEKMKPLYIRRRGELACGEHALIPVQVGSIVIDADHHRGDFHVSIYRITEIRDEETGTYAPVELLARYSEGEWDIIVPETLIRIEEAPMSEALEAVREKALCYHCRSPHYIRED